MYEKISCHGEEYDDILVSEGKFNYINILVKFCKVKEIVKDGKRQFKDEKSGKLLSDKEEQIEHAYVFLKKRMSRTKAEILKEMKKICNKKIENTDDPVLKDIYIFIKDDLPNI